ncbi:MAG: sigma-70 family RNA polymerase sigma factor [Ideonella sp.]|nr:sigma-70 family RNA polymerase sigma factor [Ideonella sp.]
MTRADGSADDGEPWDAVDERPGAEQALEALQQLDRLRQAMDRLDPPSRDLLLLLFRDDEDRLSYDEIARRLAIPVGSIGPTRSRCLAKLRRLVS